MTIASISWKYYKNKLALNKKANDFSSGNFNCHVIYSIKEPFKI